MNHTQEVVSELTKKEENKSTFAPDNTKDSPVVSATMFDTTCPPGWSKSKYKDPGDISVFQCMLAISGQQAFDDGMYVKFYFIKDAQWIEYIGKYFEYTLKDKNTLFKDMQYFHDVESYAPGTVRVNPVFKGFKKADNGWFVVEDQKTGDTILFNKYEGNLKDIISSFKVIQ